MSGVHFTGQDLPADARAILGTSARTEDNDYAVLLDKLIGMGGEVEELAVALDWAVGARLAATEDQAIHVTMLHHPLVRLMAAALGGDGPT